MLLINCDPFHSFSFPFIRYFFKTAVQKYSPELRECHKKTPVLVFFLKKQRLQVFKKGLRQSFFSVKFVKFFRTTLFWNKFRRMFLFQGLALRSPIKAISIWFGSLNKKTLLQAIRAILWNSFPPEMSEHSATICSWWSPVLIKSQVKLAEAGVHIFLEYFQFCQSITL